MHIYTLLLVISSLKETHVLYQNWPKGRQSSIEKLRLHVLFVYEMHKQ